MCKRKFLIIGEVFTDTHLSIIEPKNTIFRLGGIFHSVRAFSALDEDYAIAYYAPSYLEEDVNYFTLKLKGLGCYKLGEIDKCPNVMIVSESKEIGDQGYCNVLSEQAIYTETGDILNIIDIVKPTDILINPGRYDTRRILNRLQNLDIKIHIDMHYDSNSLLNGYLGEIETIILSTSSELFKNICNGTQGGVLEFFKNYNINNIIIKENRGGSYCYNTKSGSTTEAYSYPTKTMHSVGVGDVYNSVFISNKFDNVKNNMILASIIASKYASTMDYEVFKTKVLDVLENYNKYSQLKGIRLSWEDRKNISIYMAAPDFPYVNTDKLIKLGECLKYHNFNLKFPIKENGLSSENTTATQKAQIFSKDMELLQTCDLLIATLLYNDPGTLVEIGAFGQMKKPTILFDPYKCCNNLFAEQFSTRYCQTIEEVVEKTFELMGKGIHE